MVFELIYRLCNLFCITELVINYEMILASMVCNAMELPVKICESPTLEYDMQPDF